MTLTEGFGVLVTSSTATAARIFVVDDHPMMREGITIRIESEPDLQVVGEAEDVPEAVQRISELQLDLVIVDISLKSGHGIELIKRLRERFPKLKMLVNSMYEDSVYAERSLQAGALGYVNKQTASRTLLNAIRAVLSGKTYLSPEMTDQVLKSRVGGMVGSGMSPIQALSNRELEVLTLIGEGKTTGCIAKHLHLSVHTIDTYREKLKLKLNLANSGELNRFAVQWVLENG